ncbi:alpha/beta fold hydrolase [Alkalicoccus daliensis]|uniref:Pimeloyl-ACP methyl ester carboxylesterase n=1 Tax=Alkalicoccus daliensis TaxID=745820 RepID=A0A1H0D0F3_9BACI|nr:alpha/beta hydrolase [Alkalicoccus daliensis]SDN63622.1 Pimeloyl-ACP methyl ester carboxylesterase [Alkalicoccus daliensis]
MERTIGNFQTEGITMEYSVAGSGKPVLVMHGGHSNYKEAFGYEALLQSGYSVITPSRAGYGETSKEAGKSLALACEHYKKLLDHLQVESVHVIAMSAGGPSGIYFAAHYPEYVTSLVLESAVTKEWLTPKDKEYKAAQLIFRPGTEKITWKMISLLNNVFPKFIFRQMFSSFSSLSFKEAQELIAPEDIDAIKKMNNRQRSGAGFLIDLAQIKELSEEDLQTVSAPTLILHSRHDSSVPFAHAQYAASTIPDAELRLLDTWGHLIWLGKHGEKTDAYVVNFLDEHSG